MEMLLVEKYKKEVETLRTKLAKANEREKELIAYIHDAQKWFDKHDPNGCLQSSHPQAVKALNKFAIEQKIEGAALFASSVNEAGQFGWSDCQWLSDYAEEFSEQLRKE